MVHSAYDSVELLRGCPARIDAVASYASKLLLGCSDSSLRIYSPRSLSSSDDASASSAAAAADAAAAEIRRDSYALERAIPGFWRRPPLAMEVSASRDLLLSLSEWVALHRLPSLETLVAVAKTKGASVYSWDDRRGLLCVGRQKRVAIYRLDGGREFVEVKEFSVPDVVKSMAWCGENICLGIRREYMIMNSLTGSLSKVFPAGRIAPPLVVPLPSGELLLGKDNIGVFVDQNGKLLQDGRICWSEAPGSVVIHKPYAIARLPRHVEVRSLKAPNQLVQTIVLRDVHLLLQTNNCILAALGNSVYGLLPVPLGAQIVQLTASGDFEEALALCKLLPPEDSTLRAAKESSIHIRYGHFLFDNGSYEESMEQFLASQVDITYVLSLYPSIILPKTLNITEADKLHDLTDTSHLSRMSSDASDEMESSLPIQHQESDLEMKKMSHNSLTALVKYLQKRRFSIIERATAEVTEEVVSVVQDSMALSDPHRPKTSNKRRSQIHISSVAREMATVLDTALLQALLLTGQTSGALELLKGLNYCDLKICEEFLKERNFYIVLLELYKSNELHREALKLLNQLVEESKSGLANSELNQKFKPNMIIEYLRPLCRTDPMLVLESSLTVLESCPTETIELFLSENVPADLVNSYLKQHAPNLQSTYLELMLSMSENGINPNLQNELVQIYLSEVLDWYQDLKDEQKWDEKTYSQTRKKLISALEGISGYNAEVLLKRLPQDALFEERAILLGKLNQHHLALSLYVHKLHLPELAVAYCDRVYEAGSSQPPKSNVNIYLTLLQIYLNPQKTKKEFERRTISVPSQSPITQKVGYTKFKGSRNSKKIAEIEGADDMRISLSSTDSGRSDGDGDEYAEGGGSAMLNEALELLSQRWDRINGAQALKLLPRETKLQNLLSFLEPLLKKSSEHRRNYAVIKNLIFRAHLQVKEDLSKSRQTVVKIDGESTCSLCRKRIGNSAFAVYPNGKTLVHFVCFRDSQRIKAVRGAPPVKRL
ncbi:Vam6/Vps39-like protein [Ananas comosus]|uniref:Vam6/Vps39-like protein n=1 Tax=Ananas comosus TaxID=4615 RepID=A0A199VL11_ANACO|nr:Vam6/Vps39-like protein [Ananas comosus]